MATLKDLRLALRSQFDDWPIEDSITFECTINDLFIMVSNSDLYAPGKLLAIEQEVMRIMNVGETSGTVNVQRGYEGTTRAVHPVNSTVLIYDQYSDRKLNVRINDGIKALWPMVYQPITDETILGDGKITRFALPGGMELVNEVYLVYLWDDNVTLVRAWNISSGQIEFPLPIPIGYKLRIIGGKRYVPLEDDTKALPVEFPIGLEQAIIDYATAQLLAEREAKRTNFTEYAALLNERASRPSELGATSREFLQRFMIARAENATLRRGYKRRPF